MRTRMLIAALALFLSGCAAGFRAGGNNGVGAGAAVAPPVVYNAPPY